MLVMKNRKYLPQKPWKRFTSTPLPENADWHLLIKNAFRHREKLPKLFIIH